MKLLLCALAACIAVLAALDLLAWPVISVYWALVAVYWRRSWKGD